MKISIVLSALLAFVAAEKIVFYTSGDDHLDIESIMAQPSLVKEHLACFLDLGPCDEVRQSFKVNMVEAVATACHRCNDDQKHIWNKFLYHLKKDYPELYEAYRNKYDPKGIYMDSLEKAVAKY